MKTYRKQTIIPSCYYADIVIVHLLVLCYYILQEGRSFSLSWHNTTDSSIPAGKLPLLAKKNENGKMVVCNLQPTKYVSYCHDL